MNIKVGIIALLFFSSIYSLNTKEAIISKELKY